MHEVTALAVYNPQNPHEQAVQDAYHDATGRWLSLPETKAAMSAATSYLGLSNHFQQFPRVAAAAMFEKDNATPFFCVPCFQLELRDILRSRKVVSPHPVVAFSGVAARKVLQPYDTLLVVDPARMESPVFDLGSMKIYGHELRLGGAVVRVLTRQRLDSPNAAVCEKIVAEEYPEAAVYPDSAPPGMAFPKVAQIAPQVTDHRQKFVVNIPSLDIRNEHHKGSSDEDAVEHALDRSFRASGLPHRTPQYTVQYWRQSGFWDMIVRPLGERTASVKDEIQLDEWESKVAKLLLDVNKEFNLGLVFRFAGGWVRDKLLGRSSDDLDIALDKMTGAQFGTYLQKKIGKSGNVIRANPDQSKHLETLTINLFGRKVEFTNLRSETYADSRIPEMRFGTPEQDAFRRDLTINAMFYNLATGQVEDFTGKGREDLAHVFLRTPLAPLKTFMDDPLRTLRLANFASRFPGAAIDTDAVHAMCDERVHEALVQKVSPDRILSEMYGICKGMHPDFGLRVMYDTGIWNKIASVDASRNFHPFTMDQKSPWHVDNVFEHTLKVLAGFNAILREDGAPDDERATLVFGSFLHDVGKLDPAIIVVKTAKDGSLKNTYRGHDLVSAKFAKELLTKWKAANDDVDLITKLCENHMLPHDDVSDKVLRRFIRELGRPMVRRIIQHAKADAYSKPTNDRGHYDELLKRAETIEESAPVSNARKPVLSGSILMPMFPSLIPSSGYLREVQTRLQDLKDGKPDLTENEAVAAVEAMRPEIEQKYGMQKTAEAKQLCGTVLKRIVGLYDEKPTLVLETPQTLYAIRMSGEVGHESELEKVLGKQICALGLVQEGEFVISQYSLMPQEKPADQVRMEREKPSEITLFREGDRVRKRKPGIGFKQIDGKVVRIKDGLMYVKWNGIDDQEVFNLTDTVALHALLERH
jgi:tRNA nucleotidyltransferase/poly(A) polymerase